MTSERETRWLQMEAQAARIHLEQVVPHYPPTPEQREEHRQNLLQKLFKRKKQFVQPQVGETDIEALMTDFAKHDKRRSSFGASPIEEIWDIEHGIDHPPRTRWGRWRNQTREDFANSPPVERAGINFVNHNLEDAQVQDERPQQLSFLQRLGLKK